MKRAWILAAGAMAVSSFAQAQTDDVRQSQGAQNTTPPADQQLSYRAVFFPACQSQNSLQRVIDSKGGVKPNDCRNVVITQVGAGDQRLCALSFSSAGSDILQKLRDVAAPDQWWMPCDSLTQAGR